MDRRQVIELARSGTRVAQLAVTFELSAVTIYNWLKQERPGADRQAPLSRVSRALGVRVVLFSPAVPSSGLAPRPHFGLTGHETDLQKLVLSDPVRASVLREVSSLGLRDCWVAAGFVRNAVWDFAHGYQVASPLNDIDVIYYDELRDVDDDRRFTTYLNDAVVGQSISVKNQARMHSRNGDARYRDSEDAMRHWPETCTAIGIKLAGSFQVVAPFGLTDLFALNVRPTSSDSAAISLVKRRAADKAWLSTWPKLRLLLEVA